MPLLFIVWMTSSSSSFLWKTRTQPPSYFFGTIHVPYTRVWDFIPQAAKEAFHLSDAVYFELDLTDPYTVASLAKCQLLPEGKTLADILPAQILERLKTHLLRIKDVMSQWLSDSREATKSSAIQADLLFRQITMDWERKRPVWVLLMLNSLTESDIKTRGIPVLDLYLAQEAERKNKYTGAVESVDEQCVPLNGLSLTQVVFVLNQTLIAKEAIFENSEASIKPTITTDELIKHYQCGNLNSVIFNQDTILSLSKNGSKSSRDEILGRRIDRYFRSELILKRNRRMGQRVMHLIKSYPQKSFFFAFGAGHFIGNHSILDFVTASGLEVDPVPMRFSLPPDTSAKSSKVSRLRAPLVPSVSAIKDFSDINSDVESTDEFFSQYLNTLRTGRVKEQPNVWLEFLNNAEKVTESNVVVSPPAVVTSTPGSHRGWVHLKERSFNDLWVKLEPRDKPNVDEERDLKLPSPKLSERRFREFQLVAGLCGTKSCFPDKLPEECVPQLYGGKMPIISAHPYSPTQGILFHINKEFLRSSLLRRILTKMWGRGHLLLKFFKLITYLEHYSALEVADGADEETVRSAFLKLAKIYHPDSNCKSRDTAKFHQVEKSYRKLQEKFAKEREIENNNIKEEYPDDNKDTSGKIKEYDIDHTAPQHRQFLSFEGRGFGSVYQREKQHQARKAERATETVYRHRLRNANVTDETSLVAKNSKEAKKIQTGYGVDRLVEDLIKESMERGEFSNLKGSGKPLKEKPHNPYVDDVTRKINEVLINNGFCPPWVMQEKEIRSEISDIKNRLKSKRRELGRLPLLPEERHKWEVFQERLADDVVRLNRKINNYNLVVPSLHKQMLHFRLSRAAEKILSEGETKHDIRVTKEDRVNQDVSGEKYGLLSAFMEVFLSRKS